MRASLLRRAAAAALAVLPSLGLAGLPLLGRFLDPRLESAAPDLYLNDTVTEIIAYFVTTQTTIVGTGRRTLGLDCPREMGLGCIARVVDLERPTEVADLTGVALRTSTYLRREPECTGIPCPSSSRRESSRRFQTTTTNSSSTCCPTTTIVISDCTLRQCTETLTAATTTVTSLTSLTTFTTSTSTTITTETSSVTSTSTQIDTSTSTALVTSTSTSISTSTQTDTTTSTETATSTSTATDTTTSTLTQTQTISTTTTDTTLLTQTSTSTVLETGTTSVTSTITDTSTSTALITETSSVTSTSTALLTETTSVTSTSILTETSSVTATSTLTETSTTTSTNLITETTTSTSVFTSTTITTTTTTTTTTAGARATLSCDKYGYLIQQTSLYRVDIALGTFTLIKTALGDNSTINAMGYNVKDNYLYARQSGANQLIRIGGDGSTAVVETLPTNFSAIVADIDSDGYYWYASSGAAQWGKIDLRPGSATYGQLVDSGTTPSSNRSVADWSYVPVAGEYMYSIGTKGPTGGASLMRWPLAGPHVWEVLRDYPNITVTTFGAMYAVNNGTIYAGDNGGGYIYNFPVLNGGGNATIVSRGPASSSNDGARCVTNLDVS